MALVPLVTEGPAPTVVGTQDRFNLGGPALLITPLDHAQFNGMRPATYDLRVGKKYRDHQDRDPKELVERGTITLSPGAAFIIETEEEVHLPSTMFGYVVPKVKLLQDGVSNTLSKVDPGYHGPLVVTVFNLGKKAVTLRRLDPFCALAIHRVEGDVTPYRGKAKGIEGAVAAGLLKRMWDWIKRNAGPLALLAILAQVIRLIVEIFKGP